MPTTTDEILTWTKHRSRIALMTAQKADPGEIDLERRNLRAARLADYIRKTVDAAPPLTVEQRDRLAVLLRGGAA